MSGNAGQQENIMNPGYQSPPSEGYQPVHTEQGHGPGYYFTPFGHPAQTWPTREMFMADMSMLSAGTQQMYEYLQGVDTWYPSSGGSGGIGDGGPFRGPAPHFGPNIGESGAGDPTGISPHGFGTARGNRPGRGRRENDQGYRVTTTPGAALPSIRILGLEFQRQGAPTHEVYSVDAEGNRYDDDDRNDER